MRLLNELIHAVIFLVLFACAQLFGQMQGAKPYLYDANTGRDSNSQCASVADCVNAPDNPAIGDLLFFAVSCDQGPTPPGSTPPFTISDLKANTWHTQTAALSANAGRGSQAMQTSYSKVTVAGSDYVRVQGNGGGSGLTPCGGDGNYSYAYARFKNLNSTLDGSPVNALSSHSAGTNVDIASASKTVASNGEVAIAGFTSVANSGAVQSCYGSSTQFASSDQPNNGGGNTIVCFAICGAVGSTCTVQAVSYSSNSASVMQALYFIPDMAITDTQLPDCAVGLGCSFTIHGVGGIAALACTVTSGSSLLTGLSAGGTGNCTFSGNPAAQASGNVTFQISDGTTTASKTLAFKVGPSFKTITVVQSKQLGNTSAQAFDSSVSCGNAVVVCMIGNSDTHTGSGFVLATDGANNSINDGGVRITSFNRVPSIAGNRNGGISCAVSTPLQTSGAETIFFTQNQTSAYMLGGFMAEVQGQGIAEEGAFSHSDPTAAATSLGTTLTLPVDNTLDLLAFSSLGLSITPTSINSPFSNVYSGADGNEFLFGTATGQTAGSLTGTVNYPSTANDIGQVVAAIRPRIPSVPCGEVTSTVRHKAEVI